MTSISTLGCFGEPYRPFQSGLQNRMTRYKVLKVHNFWPYRPKIITCNLSTQPFWRGRAIRRRQSQFFFEKSCLSRGLSERGYISGYRYDSDLLTIGQLIFLQNNIELRERNISQNEKSVSKNYHPLLYLWWLVISSCYIACGNTDTNNKRVGTIDQVGSQRWKPAWSDSEVENVF